MIYNYGSIEIVSSDINIIENEIEALDYTAGTKIKYNFDDNSNFRITIFLHKLKSTNTLLILF